MSRRDDLRALLGGGMAPAAPAAAPLASDAAPRAASGAVRAMGLSLGQKQRESEQALRETAAALEVKSAEIAQLRSQMQDQMRERVNDGAHLVEILPEQIDASFAADRFTQEDEAGFAAFVEDIRAHGQQVPVLLRPHPLAPERFQIAYGHRRWRAAQRLGARVRALVKPLSDAELVVAQGQENAQRRDLSFIEKAFFARSLDEKGFDRATLCAALAVQTAEITRLLNVARAVPEALAMAIGPAPKTGRPRWLALVAALALPGAIAQAEAVQKTAAFALAANSDARFAQVLEAVSARPEPQRPEVLLPDGQGRALARRETSARETRLIFDEALAPDFAALIVAELPALHARWQRQRAGHNATPPKQET
jgi:ParB family chromosome partitioning protein